MNGIANKVRIIVLFLRNMMGYHAYSNSWNSRRWDTIAHVVIVLTSNGNHDNLAVLFRFTLKTSNFYEIMFNKNDIDKILKLSNSNS